MIDGEEFASVCHSGSAQGPLIIDVNMVTFSVEDARRFIRWLERAIDEVQADRQKRLRPGKATRGKR